MRFIYNLFIIIGLSQAYASQNAIVYEAQHNLNDYETLADFYKDVPKLEYSKSRMLSNEQITKLTRVFNGQAFGLARKKMTKELEIEQQALFTAIIALAKRTNLSIDEIYNYMMPDQANLPTQVHRFIITNLYLFTKEFKQLEPFKNQVSRAYTALKNFEQQIKSNKNFNISQNDEEILDVSISLFNQLKHKDYSNNSMVSLGNAELEVLIKNLLKENNNIVVKDDKVSQLLNIISLRFQNYFNNSEFYGLSPLATYNDNYVDYKDKISAFIEKYAPIYKDKNLFPGMDQKTIETNIRTSLEKYSLTNNNLNLLGKKIENAFMSLPPILSKKITNYLEQKDTENMMQSSKNIIGHFSDTPGHKRELYDVAQFFGESIDKFNNSTNTHILNALRKMKETDRYKHLTSLIFYTKVRDIFGASYPKTDNAPNTSLSDVFKEVIDLTSLFHIIPVIRLNQPTQSKFRNKLSINLLRYINDEKKDFVLEISCRNHPEQFDFNDAKEKIKLLNPYTMIGLKLTQAAHHPGYYFDLVDNINKINIFDYEPALVGASSSEIFNLNNFNPNKFILEINDSSCFDIRDEPARLAKYCAKALHVVLKVPFSPKNRYITSGSSSFSPRFYELKRLVDAINKINDKRTKIITLSFEKYDNDIFNVDVALQLLEEIARFKKDTINNNFDFVIQFGDIYLVEKSNIYQVSQYQSIETKILNKAQELGMTIKVTQFGTPKYFKVARSDLGSTHGHYLTGSDKGIGIIIKIEDTVSNDK